MIYKPLNGTIEDSRAEADARALSARNEAMLAYVAVMAGVELPVEESEAIPNEQEC